jgi:hypothetical protein
MKCSPCSNWLICMQTHKCSMVTGGGCTDINNKLQVVIMVIYYIPKRNKGVVPQVDFHYDLASSVRHVHILLKIHRY